MPGFSNRFPAGLVDGVDALTAAEMTGISGDLVKAANFDDGDTKSPTTAVNVGGEGIWVTELTSTTALKAVDTTSLSDGAMRRVIGLGRYRLDKSLHPSDTEDLPLVVTPTTGTGTWYALDTAAALNYSKTFTASGTWACPRNLALARVELWGGGGGGANGAGASAAAGLSAHAVGGGGGGAGQRVVAVVSPTPTTSYTVTVGAGGTGNNDGNASSLGALATANGGQRGQLPDFSANTACLAPGGKRGGEGLPLVQAGGNTLTGSYWPIGVGDGGFSTSMGAQTTIGGVGELGAAGGLAGAAGGTSTNAGGLGGGGGGGGPGGGGAVGGGAGAGTNAAAGLVNDGNPGGNAAANSGAGGGGGGAAGSAASGSSTGGGGGTGGSGQITIRGLAIVQSYA